MAQELAKLRRFLGNMPAGVCGGWLSEASETGVSRPHGWLRFHLAIQIPAHPGLSSRPAWAVTDQTDADARTGDQRGAV